MDRESLLAAIDLGPVRVYMNDGHSYEIEDHKSCLIDYIRAYVLYRDSDGKLRAQCLALVCMTRVEPIVAAAKEKRPA